MFKVETQIKQLQTDNSQLNLEWQNSFNNDLLINKSNQQQLINYRQAIVDRICFNNNCMDELKRKFNDLSLDNNLYNKMYYFLK